MYLQKKKSRLDSQKENVDELVLGETRANYEGAINENYKSATVYPRELDEILEKKVAAGRAFKLTMKEARDRYGKALTVASLGALVKSTAEGSPESE